MQMLVDSLSEVSDCLVDKVSNYCLYFCVCSASKSRAMFSNPVQPCGHSDDTSCGRTVGNLTENR